MPWSKEKRSEWCKTHRAHVNAVKKEYADAHPEYRARAIETVRRNRFKKQYGITLEQYQEMLARQGGHCALCPSTGNGRWLCVDHDHESKRVRGLLCIQCNSALGKLGDSVAGLQRAIVYLTVVSED